MRNTPDAGTHHSSSTPPPRFTLKCFACGWWNTVAVVLCSVRAGTSRRGGLIRAVAADAGRTARIGCRQLALQPDELRHTALPVFIQPIGVDEAGQIVAGRVEYRAEQGSPLGGVGRAHGWFRRIRHKSNPARFAEQFLFSLPNGSGRVVLRLNVCLTPIGGRWSSQPRPMSLAFGVIESGDRYKCDKMALIAQLHIRRESSPRRHLHTTMGLLALQDRLLSRWDDGFLHMRLLGNSRLPRCGMGLGEYGISNTTSTTT
jgi:hypothetical protein